MIALCRLKKKMNIIFVKNLVKISLTGGAQLLMLCISFYISICFNIYSSVVFPFF